MIRRKPKWGPIQYKACKESATLLEFANRPGIMAVSFSEDGGGYYGLWYRRRNSD